MIGFFKWLARLIGGNGFPTKSAGDLPNSANNTASRIAPAAFGFGGEKWVGVVGESHYQRAIARCFGANVGPRGAVDGAADLAPEDDNPHDRNAVFVMIDGRKVGYLSRYYARGRSTPDKPRRLAARAIRGDWVDHTGRKALHNVEVAI